MCCIFKLHSQYIDSHTLPIDSINTGTLYFYNGDTVVFKLVEQTEWTLHGLKMKGDLWSFKNYAKESVFKYSTVEKNHVFYIPKPFENNPMTKAEMEHYVFGKKTANYGYKTKGEFLKGFAFGIILSMLDTYEFRNTHDKGFFKNSASWLTISAPMWRTSLVKLKLNQLNKTRNYIEVDNAKACYFQGYDQIFVKKNSKSIVSGSILGASLVVVLKILVNP